MNPKLRAMGDVWNSKDGSRSLICENCTFVQSFHIWLLSVNKQFLCPGVHWKKSQVNAEKFQPNVR